MTYNELFFNFMGKTPLKNKHFHPFFELRHSLRAVRDSLKWGRVEVPVSPPSLMKYVVPKCDQIVTILSKKYVKIGTTS